MSELILIDKDSGIEVGRRPMHGSERYAYYQAQGEQIMFDGCCYRLVSVAWRLPAEDCVLSVTREACHVNPYCED